MGTMPISTEQRKNPFSTGPHFLIEFGVCTILVQVTDHGSGQIPVNRYLMQKGNDTELFLFWYHGRGRQIASEPLTKAYLTWDKLTKNRTDGALIRINSIASSGPDKALENQAEFIRSFYPILSKYIPD